LDFVVSEFPLFGRKYGDGYSILRKLYDVAVVGLRI
jgi:hypothetical protein